MKNIYIFSQSYFIVKHKDKTYEINKNCYLKLTNTHFDDFFMFGNKFNNFKTIYLNNLNTNNFVKAFQFEDKVFIELIACEFDSIVNEFICDRFNVFVYENSVRIISDRCYTYFFDAQTENFCCFNNEHIFIFNEKNLITFNKKQKTFCYLIVEKFAKSNENVEILCKISKNFNHFLHFSFNIKNNLISTKKLKQVNIPDTIFNIMSFFHLSKNNFLDAKSHMQNPKQFEDIKKYFNLFENIIEIENCYYLYNQTQIVKLNFQIIDNKIAEID